jgi:hypothetical protein
MEYKETLWDDNTLAVTQSQTGVILFIYGTEEKVVVICPRYANRCGLLSVIIQHIWDADVKQWLQGWVTLRQKKIYNTLYKHTTLIPDLIHIINSYDL